MAVGAEHVYPRIGITRVGVDLVTLLQPPAHPEEVERDQALELGRRARDRLRKRPRTVVDDVVATADQLTRAAAIVAESRRKLYALLAEDPTPPASTEA